MKDFKYSVIIPAYNAEAFIEQALDSVHAQSLQPNDLIVVDDGSRDGTSDLVNDWVARVRPNFLTTLIRQANGGLPNARNTGIRRTCAEWVALLDADDIWEPHHMACLAAGSELCPEAVAVYGAGRLLEGNVVQEGLYDQFWDNPSQTYSSALSVDARYMRLDFSVFPRLIRGNFIKPSSLMFARACADRVGLFNESLKNAEDREFLVRLLREGPFVYAAQAISRYRWHADNISQKKNSKKLAEYGMRALSLIRSNQRLMLNAAEVLELRRAIEDAVIEFLYLCSREGLKAYADGIRLSNHLFDKGTVVRAARLRHIARLMLPA